MPEDREALFSPQHRGNMCTWQPCAGGGSQGRGGPGGDRTCPVTSSWREKAFCGRSALHMPSPPTSTRDLQQERNILHFLKNCGKTHASFYLLVSLHFSGIKYIHGNSLPVQW